MTEKQKLLYGKNWFYQKKKKNLLEYPQAERIQINFCF